MTSGHRGILLMVAAVASFAVQDAFSRYLAETYNTFMVVAIRYWVFSAFVIWLALRRPEGFSAAVTTHHLSAHILRAVLLVAEICVMVWAYTLIGLIESHAVFAICPLVVVALSGPILGEAISWRRWAAVGVGLAGVLIILRPGAGVFSWASLLPMASAVMFALYSVLTRLTAKGEANFPTFFWPAVIGAVLISFVGVPSLQAIAPADVPWFAGYASVSILSNWLLQRTYQEVEASAVQPFAYLQIVFVSVLGITIFDEALAVQVAVGALVVVGAGIYALTLQRKKALG